MFLTDKNLTFLEEIPEIATEVPVAVWNKLVQSIVANYHYNNTLLEFYSNTEGCSPIEVNEYSNDKEFYGKYLNRISEDPEQQKILDDLHEELKAFLHKIKESRQNPNFKSSLSKRYLNTFQEALLELYNIITPHISEFQKDFGQYVSISYCKETDCSNFEIRTSKYEELILKKLGILSKIYAHENNDELGLKDIQDKTSLIKTASSLFKTTLFMLRFTKNKPYDSEVFLVSREYFYFLSGVFQDAKKILQQRKDIWKLEKTTATALEELSNSIEAHQALSLKSIKPEYNKAKNTTMLNQYKSKKLTKEIQPSEKLLAKQVVLQQLFTDASDAIQIKIPESELQEVIELLGGTIENCATLQRNKLCYGEQIGYVPTAYDASNHSIMSYHSKNHLIATPEALALYRDFLTRINMTPMQLWPKLYQYQGFELTITHSKQSPQ